MHSKLEQLKGRSGYGAGQIRVSLGNSSSSSDTGSADTPLLHLLLRSREQCNQLSGRSSSNGCDQALLFPLGRRFRIPVSNRDRLRTYHADELSPEGSTQRSSIA